MKWLGTCMGAMALAVAAPLAAKVTPEEAAQLGKTLTPIYHFNSGRYLITAAINEDKPYDLSASFSSDYFTSASVQKSSTK